ncbi:MAG: VOC family protein [Chloroflexi bacterium]|nr:VOC family protein [Chloroflexota bacterium]MDA1219270.1 VOC family protein [Chloroflexota bacterium]PKB57844.1 MAG: glyoxalase [SAR202 cluster bacterium Casp-Chloro-G3]
MEPRISIITLGVSNLAKSIEFYRDGLGLPLRPGEAAIAFFETKGTWLALFPRESLAEDANVPLPGGGSPGFTLAHNVRSKEEVDALIGHAVSVGATLVKPAHDAEWGGYSGYFADPDGYLWEICWNPFFWIE